MTENGRVRPSVAVYPTLPPPSRRRVDPETPTSVPRVADVLRGAHTGPAQGAGERPAAVPAGTGGTGVVEVDFAVVDRIRGELSDELTGIDRDQSLDAESRRQLARSRITAAVSVWSSQETRAQRTPPLGVERALVEAVYNAVYGMGQLQPLLDDPAIEQININGADVVWLRLTDGRKVRGTPLAADDTALVALVQSWVRASSAGAATREFGSGRPMVQATLPDDSRLSATMLVSHRPVVSIRKHTMRDVQLGDLERRGSLTRAQREFLQAAVHARFNVVITGPQGSGKALALDTPIPTPQGWTTMGELRGGDQVFDEQGAPCRVLAAHDVQHDRPCYEAVFDDGSTITADGEHLWRVTRLVDRQRTSTRQPPVYDVDHEERLRLWKLAERASEEPDQDVTVAQLVDEVGEQHKNVLRACAQQLGPTGHVRQEWKAGRGEHGVGVYDVRTFSRQLMLKNLAARRSRPRGGTERSPDSVVLMTSEIAQNLVVAAEKPWRTYNHSVQLTGALQYATKTQFLDPYVLGLWLGDGAASAARISTVDLEVLQELVRLGHPCSKVTGSGCDYGVGGDLHTKLRLLGVLGDKHIPRTYLQGDAVQRLALLHGLMDSDGYCAKRYDSSGAKRDRGAACEYTSTSEVLAGQVRELVIGLGYKAHLRSKPATYQGRTCGIAYTVAWTTRDPMFRLNRKLERQQASSQGPRARAIVDVRPVASVPVRCITVDSASSLFLAGPSCIPTHNTTLLRGLAAELPAGTRIGTLEKEFELLLHKMPERYADVVAFQTQEANSDGAGAIGMDSIFPVSLRKDLDRIIVGEVREDEMVFMLDAMTTGHEGSLCTMHANAGRDAIGRMVRLAGQGGQRLGVDQACRLIAEAVQYVVHVAKEPTAEGRFTRRVTTITEIDGGLENGWPTTNLIFDATGSLVGTPARADELARHGFSSLWHAKGRAQ